MVRIRQYIYIYIYKHYIAAYDLRLCGCVCTCLCACVCVCVRACVLPYTARRNTVYCVTTVQTLSLGGSLPDHDHRECLYLTGHIHNGSPIVNW